MGEENQSFQSDSRSENQDDYYEAIDDLNDSDFVPKNIELPKETRKSDRQKKPKQYDDYVSFQCQNEVNLDDVPMSVSEALSRADSSRWQQAMEEEMASFKKSEAWELVDSPNSGTLVECKWMFKKKIDQENKMCYRARLVAKGYTQREGLDYDETFSPVIRYSSLRLLLALSLKLDLEVTHLDVKTAFLNGNLQETVFMCQPEGFITKGNENKVCLLTKAIYGLKQSSRAWYQKVNEVLVKLGFKKSNYESCIFIKRKNNSLVIVALYVDDFIVLSNDKKETDFLKKHLTSNFEIKDLGEIKLCLGMRIRKEKDNLILDQSVYIDQLLRKFNMSDCKVVSSPINNFDFSEGCLSENEAEKYKNPLYQKLIGSLMFLAVLTRPDIAYSVSFLSQFNNNHTEYHWNCAKNVLRYLKGTKDHCLVY